MKKQLTLEHRFEVVKGLYDTWRSREAEIREMIQIHPELQKQIEKKRLSGNVERLAELTEQEFTSEIDMMRKVSHWIKETGKKLMRAAKKKEGYNRKRQEKIKKERALKFKEELFEACLSRYKQKKK